MTDRPILFSGPMVRALLDGRKTQTRRIVAMPKYRGHSEFGSSDTLGYDWHFRDKAKRWNDVRHSRLLELLPFAVGDRLWVRETWTARMTHGWTIADARSLMFQNELLYAADGKDSIDGWWPSIHMPREFSRLTLTVTDVRVQRLQDISEADAIAEGPGFVGKVTREVCESATAHRMGIGPRWRNARDWYADLWDDLNAKRGYGWDANPWVVAVTFAVHHQNIDRLRETA